MSSHPAYPANSQLREERLAELLIDEQLQAAEQFSAALTTFAFVVGRLHFPLGCPVVGYDTSDITANLTEWSRLRHDYDAEAAEAAGAF